MRSGESERSLDHIHEVALFAEDEALAWAMGEVCEPFRIGLQAGSIGLIGR
jgi:hypothetical protein